jgi:hypothetical protein
MLVFGRAADLLPVRSGCAYGHRQSFQAGLGDLLLPQLDFRRRTISVSNGMDF